jgi:hypothetical protein
VVAWTTKHAGAAPAPWDDPDTVGSKLEERSDAAGVLDFVPLGGAAIFAWLAREGLWPRAMPRTIDAAELGLTPDEIAAGRSAATRERQRLEVERRSVIVDGQRFEATDAAYAALAAHVRDTVAVGSFLASPPTIAPLAEVGALRLPPARGGDPARRSKGPVRRMTDEQKRTIGFVGESLAYEWLRRQYGDSVTPDSWKSSYRVTEHGGAGDDSLGYDFLVVLPRTSLCFEVKSTSGDLGEIELGETEIREARRHARNDRYRILFIQHALDAERRRLHVLPNPFAAAGQHRFHLVGTGLRYRFTLPS